METKEKTYNGMVINGFSAILFNLVMLPALAFLNFYLLEEVVWLAVPILLVLILAFVLMLPGYFSQEPNEARVMVFFGKYEGTFKRTGFYWVNPFMNKKKLSLRARNLDVEPIKVNDKIGNPVLIGLVLVWKLKDTYKAMFEIDAQTMAERGYLTIAFDPSFTGESGGYPRFMASPDINTEDFMAAVDFLSVREDVDPDKIGIIGICGWGGMALNAAALDTRIKATVASTMYDMTRVNANGYFDSEDSEEARYAKKQSLNTLRTEEYRKGEYSRGGGCVPLPVPEDAPFFVKDYSEYYKGRCYHKRSLNSNDGWNSIGCMSFMNQPILKYSNEIRSAVLIVHGEKAHSYYFGKDAYENMIKNSKYTSNKELLTIPGEIYTIIRM